MDILKDSDFRKELKSKPRSGYLFFGEEDYLKAFAIRQAREVICPDPTFAFFNELRIDALDYTPQRLMDALTPMPMMEERKLVILNGLNFNTMRANELDDLCEVLDELKIYDYNLLIVNAAADCLDPGYLPKSPGKVLKQLGSYLTPVNFERCTLPTTELKPPLPFARGWRNIAVTACSCLPTRSTSSATIFSPTDKRLPRRKQ